jgi:preprotein translocase subunit YajC
MIDAILSFLVPSVYAASSAGAAQPGGGLPLMVMLAVFVAFMYFAVWRPQSKRMKEQRNLLNSLAKGDEVMTTGGILGRVVKITDHYFVLAIAENTEIVIQKASVVSALPKGTIKAVQ